MYQQFKLLVLTLAFRVGVMITSVLKSMFGYYEYFHCRNNIHGYTNGLNQLCTIGNYMCCMIKLSRGISAMLLR